MQTISGALLIASLFLLAAALHCCASIQEKREQLCYDLYVDCSYDYPPRDCESELEDCITLQRERDPYGHNRNR